MRLDKELLKAMRNYLPYGKMTDLAEKNGLAKERGWLLVSGKIKNPKPTDLGFLNDCIEAAAIEKRLKDEIDGRLKKFQ